MCMIFLTNKYCKTFRSISYLTDCLQIVDGVCIQCVSGYGMKDNKCVACNWPFEYFDSLTSLCVSCKFPCLTCVGPDSCSGCVESFFLEQGKCESCASSCLRCYDQKYCMACVSPFQYDTSSESCVRPIDTGVEQAFNQTIEPSTAINAAQAQILQNLDFLESEPNSQSEQSTLGECLLKDRQDQCVICKTGYYAVKGLCKNCIGNCSRCLNFSGCLKCTNGFTLTKSETSFGFTCISDSEKVIIYSL